MDKTAFEKYLSGRYREQVEWYDKQAALNKRWAIRLRIAAGACGLVSAFLIQMGAHGLAAPMRYWFDAATVFSMLVALIGVINGAYDFHRNWINYRTTCETLRKEKSYYEARAYDYADADDPDRLFVERVENIISRENTMWRSGRLGNSHKSA